MDLSDLHGYQRRAIDFLMGGEARGLFLDMGMGKTVSTLVALDRMLASGQAKKVLVIAPKRVAERTWPDEAQKWAGVCGYRRIKGITGTPVQRKKALDDKAAIHAIGIDNLVWLATGVAEKTWDWGYDTVVLDESSLFRDQGSKRFKALRFVRKHIRRVILLTGTPTPNSLLELWPQLWIMDQGERLGRSFTAYRDAYFESDWNGWVWKIKPFSDEAIYGKISDICMSLQAKDYLELPPRMDNYLRVGLGDRERKAYQQMEKEFLLPLVEGEATAVNSAVLAGKLMQLANGAIYRDGGGFEVLHDQKLDALAEIVDAATGPVLVAYGYKSDLERIRKRIKDVEVATDPGVLDRWSEGKCKVMACHPKSAGHGLNLQDGGSTMVWFGLTWSMDLYKQFNARLHRQGQTKPVVIHHIVAEGTIDEDCLAVIEGKVQSQQALMDALTRRAGAGERQAQNEKRPDQPGVSLGNRKGGAVSQAAA